MLLQVSSVFDVDELQNCLSNVTEQAVHEIASKLNFDVGGLEENFK
jgi:hypothetical protein